MTISISVRFVCMNVLRCLCLSAIIRFTLLKVRVRWFMFCIGSDTSKMFDSISCCICSSSPLRFARAASPTRLIRQ